MSKHTAPDIISTNIQRKMVVYCCVRQTVRQDQQETQCWINARWFIV